LLTARGCFPDGKDDGGGDGANRRSRTVSGPAHSTSAISSASTAQSAITDSGAGADPAPAAAAAYAGAVSRVRYPSNLVPRPAAAAAAAAVQQQEHMSPALSSARASIPTSPHSRVASGRSVRSGGYPVAADAAAATAHLRTASQHSRFSAFSGATDGGAGAGAGAGAGRVRQPSQLSTFSTMSGGPPILQPDPNDPIHTISPDDTPEMLAKKVRAFSSPRHTELREVVALTSDRRVLLAAFHPYRLTCRCTATP